MWFGSLNWTVNHSFPIVWKKKVLLVANDFKEKTINSFEREHEMEGTLD